MSDTRNPRERVRDSTPAAASDIETMHDVLSDWERRAILYSLEERGGSAAVADVVSDLVGWRCGQANPAPAADEVVAHERERIGREQLQKLDDFDVLDYDPGRGRVQLADEMRVSISEPWNTRPPDTMRTPHDSSADPDV